VCDSDRVAEGTPEPAWPRRVVVVGGGVTGLSTAWFLAQAPDPPEVVVLEASPDVGGKLRAGDLGGYLVDAGAESMLARRREAVDLARALGLGEALEAPRTTAARVLVDAELRAFPAGTVLGVPGDIRALRTSGVLTRRGLARAAAERLLPATAAQGDVSVGRYVTSRLGHEVTERLVEPLLGGVYAGHADDLSLAATVPSLAEARMRGEGLLAAAAGIRRAAGGTADGSAPFVGIAGGLARLPGRLVATSRARVRTRSTVRELRRQADGTWHVVVGPAPRPEVEVADAVVLAVPAGPAARLLRPHAPVAAGLLDTVAYASVALVALGYRPGDVPGRALQGSGHLVPPREGRVVKAATYSSSKWAWVRESVDDLTVVRMSVGRLGEEGDLQRDDTELVRLATEDAADVLGLGVRPVAGAVFRWGGSLPQYRPGHPGRVERVRSVLATETPGVVVAGAAVDGVGIPSCVASARRAADEVLRATATGATMEP
jgi:oxygen-dependent protoporphyrinogen oxidase